MNSERGDKCPDADQGVGIQRREADQGTEADNNKQKL